MCLLVERWEVGYLVYWSLYVQGILYGEEEAAVNSVNHQNKQIEVTPPPTTTTTNNNNISNS